jgi:hypothetical protein
MTCRSRRGGARAAVRGVLLVALDVAEQVRRRHAVEANAAGWQERFETGRDGMTALQPALLPEEANRHRFSDW